MNNSEIYLKRLKGSLKEKLFFMDHIDLDNKIVIDFGCADGTLLKALRKINESQGIHCIYIGVEKNEEFYKIADNELKSTFMFHNLAEVKEFLAGSKSEVVLITSSVLHECNYVEQFALKGFVIDYCDYWVIRDMFYNDENSDFFIKFGENIVKIIENTKNIEQLKSFFKTRLNISSADIAEWLLKYPYIENWDSEVKENYFSTHWEILVRDEFLYYLQKYTTQIIYDNQYTNEYIKNRVKKDYDIDLTCTTHRQLILKYIEEEN